MGYKRREGCYGGYKNEVIRIGRCGGPGSSWETLESIIRMLAQATACHLLIATLKEVEKNGKCSSPERGRALIASYFFTSSIAFEIDNPFSKLTVMVKSPVTFLSVYQLVIYCPSVSSILT